ncbi:GNAT family N-acetyltransferase [Gordoniibacillus kamchatkensis]|uniref:GNAT family N-acetyltransferase n=1 Tax=Gordoniibacillus kamchatkensis TaxID=1590651 RepID=UPI002F4254E9
MEEGELAGAIAYECEGGTITISRMMVHPHYFRRGIASKLLRHVFALEPDAARYVVSTGALNAPALKLYESAGFEEQYRREIAPGIELVTLAKPGGGATH